MTAFDAWEAAVVEQADLIDNPDKTISVDAYKAKLKAAARKVARTHKALLAAVPESSQHAG